METQKVYKLVWKLMWKLHTTFLGALQPLYRKVKRARRILKKEKGKRKVSSHGKSAVCDDPIGLTFENLCLL